jgi:hypothetical protein
MGNIIYKRKQTITGGSSSIAGLTLQGTKSTDFTATANLIYEITASCKMTLPSSPSTNDKIAFFLTSTANFDISSTNKINGSVLATDYVYRVKQLYVIVVLTYSGSTNGWIWESRDNAYLSLTFTGNGIEFVYSNPGDTNGLFYYLGATKYGSVFQNPINRGEIIVTASGNIGDGRTADKAFDRLNDGNNSSPGYVWHSPSSNTGWIMVQFTNNKVFKLTSLELWASSAHSLANFMGPNCLIQGSNNGSTWTTLLTFYPNVVSNTRWYSGSISNANFYNYYRIYSPQTIYHVIGDIEFYGELQL